MRTGVGGRRQWRSGAQADWEAAAIELLAGLWRLRLELALVGAAAAAQRLLARPLGDALAAALVFALVGAPLVATPSRRLLARSLRLAHLRRAWERAATDAGLSGGPLRMARVLRASREPAGDELRVRVRRGQAVADLDARRDALAACLRVREVRVLREPADAATARVTLVRRDPFEGGEPLRWPGADADELSLWEPVPIGVDERGEPEWRDVDLERRMLMVRRGFAKGRLKEYGKTAGSRRAVPLRARVVTALERLEQGRGIVFSAPEGGRIDINNWRFRSWTPALAAAGVKHRRIYDLRHTYATWSLSAGVDIFTLARRMGMSVKMIDRTYGHLVAGADVYERELLDAFDRSHAESDGRAVDAQGDADAA
jgi:hypothetical protein